MKYQLTLAVAPLLWHATVAEIVLIGTCKAQHNTCFMPIGENERWIVPDAHEFKAVCGLGDNLRCQKDGDPCFLRAKTGILADCRVHKK